MASTRIKNSKTDYQRESAEKDLFKEHVMNTSRRFAHKNALPAAGINVGQMPRESLAKNATDIESALYGIGSSNLVEEKGPVQPQLHNLPSVHFFERNTSVIVPQHLVIERDQRPARP